MAPRQPVLWWVVFSAAVAASIGMLLAGTVRHSPWWLVAAFVVAIGSFALAMWAQRKEPSESTS